ncbi:hypothetical protein GCM10022297_09700 [Lactobacillus hamsteri]
MKKIFIIICYLGIPDYLLRKRYFNLEGLLKSNNRSIINIIKNHPYFHGIKNVMADINDLKKEGNYRFYSTM